jgi:hypothetical protein
MAGRGPAPKPKAQRRRANEPARGEWMDLEPLETAVLPPIGPREGGWSRATKARWDAWRQDPSSPQWSPADVAYARDTIERFERGAPSLELRLRMDGLGLTPKGKRDLRWRTGNGEAEKSARPKLADSNGCALSIPAGSRNSAAGKPLFSAPSIRARRLPASAALLPQPHGFEGLSLVRVVVDADDLAAAQRAHGRERQFDRDSAPLARPG